MVRSFRDLEVYQKTIQLSNELLSLDFLKKKEFEEEKKQIKETVELIPELIADSYGVKFDSKELANKRLTKSISLVTKIITKIDLLKQRFQDDKAGDNKNQRSSYKETVETLNKLITNYQRQKIKILNLRKAWNRLAEYDKNKIKSKKIA